MNFVLALTIGFVAIQHIFFLVLEMFLWTKPLGRKVFRMTPEKASSTAVLAANQGLYNGFLAAGLIWSLWSEQLSMATFFLSCVVIAGIFGGATVNRRIFFIQAIPGVIGLVLIYFQ